MPEPKRNPAAGAALGALSAARNRKIMTVAGAVLIAIGVAGMIMVGSQAGQAIQNQQFNMDMGKSIQLMEYVFMFVLIGGLGLVIYSQVSAQRDKTKQRESQADHDTNAA